MVQGGIRVDEPRTEGVAFQRFRILYVIAVSSTGIAGDENVEDGLHGLLVIHEGFPRKRFPVAQSAGFPSFTDFVEGDVRVASD